MSVFRDQYPQIKYTQKAYKAIIDQNEGDDKEKYIIPALTF